LFDTFIYISVPSFVGIDSTDPSPIYIIEVDKSLLQNLKTHLQRYKLRSKFQIHEVPASQLQLFSIWPTLLPHTPNADSLDIIDPRSPNLGTRLLSRKPPSSQLFPSELYHLRRNLHGVPEGPEEILEGVALPAESNLDVMSGIDFTKGCYVGQELTSRTYHTGVIRKRLLPLSLYPPSGEVQEPMTLVYDPAISLSLPPSGTALAAKGEKRSPGKFLRGWGNLGWGLCRLDYVGRTLKCEWDGGTILAKPFLPEWADRAAGSVEK
jgi:transferase CAF17, mitochondrial